MVGMGVAMGMMGVRITPVVSLSPKWLFVRGRVLGLGVGGPRVKAGN